MNKWGVRLIGCYFLIWAISDLVELIIGTHSKKGFMGFYIEIGGLDIAPWIGVCILFYTVFQLVRFDNSGRIWALIMLWPYTIIWGALFIAALVSFFSPPVRERLSSSFTWTWTMVPKPEPPVGFSLFVGVVFINFLVPLYYLLRKNTKALFQKIITAEENNPNPETPTP